MQFHLNGFRPGDPSVCDATESGKRSGNCLPAAVDVLIVGAGPAGLTLAAQLSAFPEIRTAIVEQKPERLLLGQADGIACRTMEMFEAFGFSERVLKEAYWVNETCFWRPGDSGDETIIRSGRIQDTEDGLSEFPHVILNQARVHDFYLDLMANSAPRLSPYYSTRVTDLQVERGAEGEAVIVRLDHEGMQETIRANYVVGCDGARSTVRKALGLSLHGDSANQVWGVMDVLAVTDFPDIRMKAVIHASKRGSVLIIPREGGYLVRLYIEMDKLAAHERVADKNITIDRLIASATRILHPYTLDVKEVVWWSAYEIGQRLCDKFDDVPEAEIAGRFPRIFIAGDACHTHSPKAGQGMNVSMADGFNLGWKLASVIRGQATPALLHTYSAERRALAKELIDFDRAFAAMISAPEKNTADLQEHGTFQDYFVKQARFTAGVAVQYQPSIIVGGADHQNLANGFPVGARFHSAPVVRLSDGKPLQLGHINKADARWRIFIFNDTTDPSAPTSALQTLCAFLDSQHSPIRRYTPRDADIDSVIDVRAVFQQQHRALSLGEMPAVLLPRKGRHELIDYEKMFCPDLKNGQDIFELRGLDRSGCIVIVRPDQFVAEVLPLAASAEVGAFFDRFLLPAPLDS